MFLIVLLGLSTAFTQKEMDESSEAVEALNAINTLNFMRYKDNIQHGHSNPKIHQLLIDKSNIKVEKYSLPLTTTTMTFPSYPSIKPGAPSGDIKQCNAGLFVGIVVLVTTCMMMVE
jgi:hypothetical protein